MLACFEDATESTWGLPRVGPRCLSRFTSALTSTCSASVKPSHQARNSSVNSTSHSSKGIYLQKPCVSIVSCRQQGRIHDAGLCQSNHRTRLFGRADGMPHALNGILRPVLPDLQMEIHDQVPAAHCFFPSVQTTPCADTLRLCGDLS